MDPGTLTSLAFYGAMLLVGSSIPLVKRLRGRSRRKALERWAMEQGLTGGDNGPWRGTIDEQRIAIAHDAGGPVSLSLQLRPALDLGLLIQPPHWNVARHLERADVDDRAFDTALHGYGTERYRVQQLLSPELRGKLRGLLPETTGLRLSDGGLQLWLDASRANGAEIAQIVHRAGAIMAEVERRRMALPAARDLAEYLPDWLAFAEEHDLQLSRAPLGLRGTLHGRDVWAVVVRSAVPWRTDASHRLDVLVWFEPPLSVAFSLKSTDVEQRQVAAGHADPTGFHTAFTLVTDDDRAHHLLDRRLQERLVRMRQQRGPVELNPGWLWVQIPTLPTEPSQALALMEEVADLGHAISIAARAAAGGGSTPYRARQ